MSKYTVFMLKANGKAVRYNNANVKNKMEAIELMTSAWESERKHKSNKAMYVADLTKGNIVHMAM